MKKKMLTKIAAGVLTLAMGVSMAGCGNAADQNAGGSKSDDTVVIGDLSFCNADEESVRLHETARMISRIMQKNLGNIDMNLPSGDSVKAVPADAPSKEDMFDLDKVDAKSILEHTQVKLYDSLTAMTMALQSGDIDMMTVYDVVADYVCARNSDLEVIDKVNFDNVPEEAKMRAIRGNAASDELSFMMTEANEALRDEFNTAITAMKEDGSLDAMIKSYMFDADKTKDPEAVAIETIDGAETVKVGVTGDLPPFDYISADGTPAGFNTAVLSEISKRIGKNIELVNIDAGGRVMALSTGKVDVVFWTRSQVGPRSGAFDYDKLKERVDSVGGAGEIVAKGTKLVNDIVSMEDLTKNDQPDGTIITDYYFTVMTVNVVKKS